MSNWDITFCSNTGCKEYGCIRNQTGIPKELKLVSIADFKDCKYWEKVEEEKE